MNTIQSICRECGQSNDMPAYSHIDVNASPELKERVLSGELFKWTCPRCGKVNLIKYPLMYHDADARLLLVLSDTPVCAENLPEGYQGRLVKSIGALIEKIKISDAGLDDVTVEMCKFVTARELGKDVSLKFFRMEGADGDLTFTYPEKDCMQMLAVGFNVYEDCRRIVGRNPGLCPSGLAEVDERWILGNLK